jgi:hypothetical protein
MLLCFHRSQVHGRFRRVVLGSFIRKRRQMFPAARKSARAVRAATGIVCRIFHECGSQASAAVSAVVALPHGLSRSLVFRVFVAVVLIVFVVLGRTQHDLAGAVTVRKWQRLLSFARHT